MEIYLHILYAFMVWCLGTGKTIPFIIQGAFFGDNAKCTQTINFICLLLQKFSSYSFELCDLYDFTVPSAGLNRN